nr:hypothetical protein [Tanacetum cinerariifolium]
MLTRSMAAKLKAASASEFLFADFLSEIEPKKVSKALKHPRWIDAMQEELNQFYRNKAWTLVPLPYGKIAIGSKWVFKNKKDDHVAIMEAIRIVLTFATYMNFKFYQMDVKSAFLNSKLKEEVYVKQPYGFESSEFPDYVCKLDKALYGLKQAPRAWYPSFVTTLVPLQYPTIQYFTQEPSILILEQQKIKYAPQWNNMTVENVILQTNNVSTAVAFEPFPSTDEPEKRLLKEFLIKFSISNGQRPLTLDFQTFCSSTGLHYNNGKYVEHPTPKVVKKELGKIAINPSYLDKTPVLKNSFPVAWRILFTFVIQILGGNYSSTKQVNSIQQLLAYNLITGTEVDIWDIIYSDLVTKLLNKSKLKYVSYPRFISCHLQVLLGPDYTYDKKFWFLPLILSNSNYTKYPSKVTKIELTAHMIDVNNRRDSVSPPPLAAKPKKGKSQTMTSTLPSHRALSLQQHSLRRVKDLSLKSHSLRLRDITFTTPDEGTAKTTSHSEESLKDKDSGGNKPPADMEPLHTTDADLSGIGAKYQEDQTQSSRLRYQSLTEYEAILLSEDEAQESKEDILGADDKMDENPQSNKTQHQSSPPQKDKPTSSTAPHPEASDTDSSSDNILKKITEDQWENHEEAAVYYANLKASIDDYYNKNIAHRDQTDQLVEASRSSLEKSSTTITDLYKGLEETDSNIQEKDEEPKQSTDANIGFIGLSTYPPIIKAQPITIIHPKPFVPQREGKGIATNDQAEDQRKLVKALSIIRPGPDEPDKEEKIKKAEEEARLNAISKTEVIKMVREEAKKIGIYPKEAISSKAVKLFNKAQDAEHKTVSSRLKPKPITDIKIHSKTKSVVITIYKGTDGRNFDVHKPFLFGALGIYKLDDLREIILKKKNTMKHVDLEPKTRIPGLECNRTLPVNVSFVNNMVIEEPEYGIFFTDEFGDQALQR